MNTEALTAYKEARTKRLQTIVETLTEDERFVAAWLTGSLGRGGGDAMSDIDLNLVVRTQDVDVLCAQPWRSGGKTTPEREALIRQFGTPTIIHDTHDNAPPPGCFTLTFYAEDHQEVDWILLPQTHAKRPFDSCLLFEKEPIPVEPPPTTAVQFDSDQLTDAVSYFWLMAAAGVKFIMRQAQWRANEQIQVMNRTLQTVKMMLAGEREPFTLLPLLNTPADQRTAVWDLCQQMQALQDEITSAGASFPERAIDTVAARLALL